MRFSRKGFTLIELIIVVIIIGILAAIAAPLMTSNVQKAKTAEAVAALGAIRTAERLYYIEHDTYVQFSSMFGGDINDLSGYLRPSDLNGLYFDASSYSVIENVGYANGNASTAPKNGDVHGVFVNMDMISGSRGDSDVPSYFFN